MEPRVDAWRRCGVCLTTYSGAGAVALAEEFLERSLRKESHYIPAARHALGAALLNCGDPRAAATLERALREKRSYGEDGPAVAAVLNDLGIASGEEERFREALEIYAHPDPCWRPRTRPARASIWATRFVEEAATARRSMSTNRPSPF